MVTCMYAATDGVSGLDELAMQQAGVVRREQLTRLGIDHRIVNRHILAERWSPWGSRVVALQNVPLAGAQLWWAGVLHAGPGSALASLTALEAAGLTGFEESGQSHVIVARGAKVPPRPAPASRSTTRVDCQLLTSTRVERFLNCGRPGACIDAASWTRHPRRAIAILAATVQQRLCRADHLREVLAVSGQIRHAKLIRMQLGDIEGGAEALCEIDLVRLCRTFGLQPPAQQQVRRTSDGRRRYLDCLWELPDGSTIVLEIDGAHHLSVEQWVRHTGRERSLVLRVGKVLRCSAYEARFEHASLAADFLAAGVPRLVRSSAA